MANRYSQITPSQFQPLSLQEIMATPLMQRQKHDQLIAQQEMLRQGLAKVDPLDVHMNEALNVKSQMENKLRSQADLLSKEGINPNTQGEFLALNREYQNLISPTGRLGQINAAKQVYAKNFNDYLEDATKNKGWSRERALANWNNYAKQYTGFTDDKITNIGQLGAPKKIEVLDVLKDVKGLLGEQVVGEMKASGYSFQPSPDGGMVMVDRSGRRIETSNRPNLQAAQNLINQRLMGKEWQDSIRFEGEVTRNIYNQLTSGINSMLSNKVVDNRGENAQYIAPKTTENATTSLNPSIFGEDYNTVEVGGKAGNYDQIEKIGKKITGVPGQFQHSRNTSNVSSITSENISDPKQKAIYDITWKKATTGEGIILDGKRVHLNPDLIKKGKDNPIVVSQLLRSIKQNPALTLTSKLLTTNNDINNSGFTSSLGKTEVDRDKQIRRELQMTNQGARKLLDPKTGQPLSFAEAQEKYDLVGTEGVTYQGYLSPLNWEEQSFAGTNSKASPHIITVKTKDGNYVEFKTSRINSDNTGININRYNDLQKNYRKYTLEPNEFIKFESNSPALQDLKIKYNINNPTIDPQRGVLNYEILKGDKLYKMNESEYINSINRTK